MKIAGIQKMTLIDYPGKIAATIFIAGCNFRCPFCHNPRLVIRIKQADLISEDEVLDFLKSRVNYLDAVCFTGGEPLISQDISLFFQKVKDLGFLIKLDTNGTSPDLLKKVVEQKLIDYVAMDIKAPLDWVSYKKVIGVDSPELFNRVKQSINFLLNSKDLDYEFRTTAVPKLIKLNDLEKIAGQIKGAKKYSIQQFSNQGKMIDSSFSDVTPYKKDELLDICEKLKKDIKNCQLKNI